MCKFFRNQDDPIFTPAHGPNTVTPMNRELYSIMGQENIFKNARRFLLGARKSDIARCFQKILTASKKSAAFFVVLWEDLHFIWSFMALHA